MLLRNFASTDALYVHQGQLKKNVEQSSPMCLIGIR